MQMDQGMDTGNILTQTAIPIPADFTSRALHDALAFIAPDSLMAVLDNIPYVLENARTQDDTAATYAPKIAKQDARIDWHQSMETIDRQIRAYNPWPVAYTTHADLTLRIHQAHPLSTRSNLPAGTLVRIDNNSLVVSTSTQDLALDVIQFPGKNPVNIADWSKSHKRQVDEGMQFT
jgi:methionyl-tRNA formyltransferase